MQTPSCRAPAQPSPPAGRKDARNARKHTGKLQHIPGAELGTAACIPPQTHHHGGSLPIRGRGGAGLEPRASPVRAGSSRCGAAGFPQKLKNQNPQIPKNPNPQNPRHPALGAAEAPPRMQIRAECSQWGSRGRVYGGTGPGMCARRLPGRTRVSGTGTGQHRGHRGGTGVAQGLGGTGRGLGMGNGPGRELGPGASEGGPGSWVDRALGSAEWRGQSG